LIDYLFRVSPAIVSKKEEDIESTSHRPASPHLHKIRLSGKRIADEIAEIAASKLTISQILHEKLPEMSQLVRPFRLE
jgi:hypothetical protein